MIRYLIPIFIIFIICHLISPAYSKTSQELLEEARLLRADGFYDSAIAIYKQLMIDEPNNIQVIYDFGDLMIERRNYLYAITLYKKYLELKPDDIKIRELVVDIYNALELYDLAANECLTFLRNDPENIKFLIKLKDIYHRANLFKKEMAVTEEIIKIKPEDKEVKIRLLELYIINSQYDKASELLDKTDNSIYPLSVIAYIYLNNNNYDKALELYHKIYTQEPSEINKISFVKARLSEIKFNSERSLRYYRGYYNLLNNTCSFNPQDNDLQRLLNFMDQDIGGVYTGFEYIKGRNGNNKYYNYSGYIQYPVLSTNTELFLKFQRYEIENENLSNIYRRFGLEFRQQIGKYITITGGYGDGLPGNSYYGQVFFQGNKIDFGVKTRKDWVMETPEALQNKISFTGMDYYINFIPVERWNIFGTYSDYDFTDNNNGKFSQIGTFYRIWDNERSTWVNLGVSYSGESFSYQSPLYYSPLSISQMNYGIEWDYYFTEDSLLRINYSRSFDNQNVSANYYSIYGDHKFENNLFIYAQYINGISYAGLIGLLQQPNQDNNEFTAGLKYKF